MPVCGPSCRLILIMSWLIWPLLKRTVLLHIVLRRSKRHQQDPRVLSHRDIVWCRILHQDLHREMPQWAGLFLGRLSSKEDSDLQCFSSCDTSGVSTFKYNQCTLVKVKRKIWEFDSKRKGQIKDKLYKRN